MWIIVGGFMSADGKIAPANRNGKEFTQFMTPTHKNILHNIRASVDAIIVGVDTVIADDPSLTVRETKGKTPLRIVLDSNARTPINAKILNTKEAPTLIATAKKAPKQKTAALINKKAEVFTSSAEQTVNLQELMTNLRNRGIKKVLVEGGAEVRWSFIKENLVDELFVWIMPYVWGGKDAPTLVDGQGFLKARDAQKMKLKNVEQVEELLILWYSVEH